MRTDPILGRTYRRYFVLGVVLGFGAAGLLGAPVPAHAISCGDVLGPGGSEALSGDLVCEESPALVVEGPTIIDLQGFTLACALADDGSLAGTGIEVIGSQARIRNGTIENCDRGVVVEGDGRHRLLHLTVTSPEVQGNGGIAFLVNSDRNHFISNIVTHYAGEGFRLSDGNVPANR
jgi:hypothetical protein